MLSPEELLSPRYKVIADYPKSLYQVGEIIRAGGTTEDLIYCDREGPRCRDFPHLFKPLAWWEERKPEDMPEYVKHIDGEVALCRNWHNSNGGIKFNMLANGEWTEWYCVEKVMCFFTPATEADYLTYKNKNNE